MLRNTIYIGTTLKKDGVMQNEIFNDRPTELIERLKEKFPLIELLFVSADDYIDASAELVTAGSARFKALEQIKKGGVD